MFTQNQSFKKLTASLFVQPAVSGSAEGSFFLSLLFSSVLPFSPAFPVSSLRVCTLSHSHGVLSSFLCLSVSFPHPTSCPPLLLLHMYTVVLFSFMVSPFRILTSPSLSPNFYFVSLVTPLPPSSSLYDTLLHLSMYLTVIHICLSIHPFIHVIIHLSTHLSIHLLSIHPSINQFIYPSTHSFI